MPTLFEFNKVPQPVMQSRLSRAQRASNRHTITKCTTSHTEEQDTSETSSHVTTLRNTSLASQTLSLTTDVSVDGPNISRQAEGLASETSEGLEIELDTDAGTLQSEIRDEAIVSDEDIEVDGDRVIEEDNEHDVDLDMTLQTDEEPHQEQQVQEMEEQEISDEPAFRLVEELSHDICELQLQNELLLVELAELKEENQTLAEKLHACTQYSGVVENAYASSSQHAASLIVSLKAAKFGADLIHNDDKKTQFYTGLTSYSVFEMLFTLLKPFVKKSKSPHCTIMDEFFITLTKLKLGLVYKDITYRTNIAESDVSKIFHKWLDIMYCELQQLIVWPDREKLYETLPAQFKKHYFNVISIIDCFEIFTEKSLSLNPRSCTYSQYKKHNTLKILISIAPTGAITFVSKVWGGRVSDKVITQKSGFLDYISYGDVVMADRGFNISDDLAIRGAQLEIPAFTRGKKQLSMAEVEKTRQLARLRIHVERVIGLLRNKYTILQGVIPITLIKRPSDTSVATIDKIVTISAALINTSNSIVLK